MGKSRNKQGLLDTLIGEMLNYGAEDDQSVMDIIFSGDQKSISSIPLRYRIIGLGFVRKMSLEELNEKLESNGCEKLYGRSIYEASLMHAFNRPLPSSFLMVHPTHGILISACAILPILL